MLPYKSTKASLSLNVRLLVVIFPVRLALSPYKYLIKFISACIASQLQSKEIVFKLAGLVLYKLKAWL
nr:MAG TPA: hypothetical protein [Bacteriophage sp.]